MVEQLDELIRERVICTEVLDTVQATCRNCINKLKQPAANAPNWLAVSFENQLIDQDLFSYHLHELATAITDKIQFFRELQSELQDLALRTQHQDLFSD